MAQKSTNICPSLVRKFVDNNFKKSPNLVTLSQWVRMHVPSFCPAAWVWIQSLPSTYTFLRFKLIYITDVTYELFIYELANQQHNYQINVSQTYQVSRSENASNHTQISTEHT